MQIPGLATLNHRLPNHPPPFYMQGALMRIPNREPPAGSQGEPWEWGSFGGDEETIGQREHSPLITLYWALWVRLQSLSPYIPRLRAPRLMGSHTLQLVCRE